MQEKYTPKPGSRSFRPSRAKPWQLTLPEIHQAKSAGPATATLIYGFAAIIALGTILLMLPVSSKLGQITHPVTALFTATSAVCVTGLVVVDTGTYWSNFGQAVILLLFQLGGFGFMTGATVLLMAMGRRIGLRERMLISESIGVARLGGLVNIVRKMAIFTAIAEGAGIIILFFSFLGHTPVRTALWQAVFHSISAFNNCGMDIFGDFKSLADYHGNALVLVTFAALFILGGTGYVVVDDILAKRRFSRLATDSKIVIVTTLVLLTLGLIFIFLAEFSNTLGAYSLPEKISVAFFQAATPRTAGFSVIDIGKVLSPTLFFIIFLMIIGGASGSTAGGVKVNTFGVLVTVALSALQGKEHATAFGRELSAQNIYRALALVMVYLVVAGAVVLGLSMTEKFEFTRILFETFSALGTVGLSTGITPDLSMAGQIILVLTMFFGRLGPLTFTAILIGGEQTADFRLPKDIIRVG